MGQVKYVDGRELTPNKPLELNLYLDEHQKWSDENVPEPNDLENLVYLGHDDEWGDMFSGTTKEKIAGTYVEILRGNLNSGRW